MNTALVKRVVAQELPDQAAVDAHELGVSLEDARAILALASRVLQAGFANERNTLGRAARVIGRAMSAELVDEDGDVMPAPLEVPVRRLTCAGTTGAKRLRIDPMELNAAWALGQQHPTSCFPLEVVLAFLEPPAWPYLAAFMAAGPDWASVRVDAAADALGVTHGYKTLSCHIDEVWKLIGQLVELRKAFAKSSLLRAANGKPAVRVPAALEPWTFVPARPSASALQQKASGGRKNDTSAVPLHLIRKRLHELARGAEWGRWKPAEWPQGRNWRALKRLALLAVLAATGPRIAHLQSIRVEDVDPDHLFFDGTRGPALLFRGERKMKGRRKGYAYAVRLPDSLFEILVAWLACNGRRPGEPGSLPLFPSAKRRDAADPQTFHARLGTTVSGRGQEAALIPYEGEET